jgi:hypothetical protein
MTRNEREQLIQRYMGGEMPLAEEHDFFIQVALDKQLWLDLKAHQTVESAMMKDRVVEPSEIAMMGAQVAAMLAATHAGAGGGSSAPSVQSAASAGMESAATIGAGAMKWLAVALGMTGLVASSAIIAPLLPPPVMPPPHPAAIAAPHSAPIEIAPAETEAAEPTPDAIPHPVASPIHPREEARGAAVRRGRSGEITGAAEASPRASARNPARQAPAPRSAGDSIPLGARFKIMQRSGK